MEILPVETDVLMNDLNSNLDKRAKTYPSNQSCVKTGKFSKTENCNTVLDVRKHVGFNRVLLPIQEHDSKFRSSARKKNLKVVHNEGKNFKANQCEYSTSQNSYVKRYLKGIHSQEKFRKCDQCDYFASQNSDLTRHVNGVHNQEKNFKCEKCDFSTFRKSSLKQYGHIQSLLPSYEPALYGY